MEGLASALPPLFVTAGGIVPFLVRANPFRMNPIAQRFAGATFAALVWLAYLAATPLARVTLFSAWVPLALVGAGAVALVGLLLQVLKTGVASPGRARSPILYAAGLLAISMGITAHIESEGQVVVLTPPSATRIEFEFGDGLAPVDLNGAWARGVVLDAADYGRVQRISVASPAGRRDFAGAEILPTGKRGRARLLDISRENVP